MRLARWHDGTRPRYALGAGDGWLDLVEVLAHGTGPGPAARDGWEQRLAASSGAMVEALPLAREVVAATGPRAAWALDGDEVAGALLAPVWGEVAIYCASLNYHSHIRETGLAVPDQPQFFFKPVRCVVPPGGDVELPAISAKPDYEAELAVVVGRTAKHLTEEDALDHVAGYTVIDDVSFRDLQIDPERPGVVDWVMGKALDTAAPTGPWITTADEVPDPQDLALRLWIGDDLRQDGRTSDMVFGVARLLAELTRAITLRPGDVIATGTCSGVGSRTGRFLQPGDHVTLEVEGVGRLTHGVVAEAPAPSAGGPRR